MCDIEISGKNPTNLKKHMNAYHPKVFQEFEKENELTKEKKSKKQFTDSASGSLTLHEFVKRQSGKYSYDSPEYKERLDAVNAWIVASGCPLHQLDLPEFKLMLKACDKKFLVPGR